MKQLFAAMAFISFTLMCKAQGVGIGTTSPAASAQLDISSTSKGILFPRMTTAARMAINNPAKGLLVYDSTLQQFQFYNGSRWSPVGSGSSGWKTGGQVPDFQGNPPFETVSTDPTRRLVTIESPSIKDHNGTGTNYKGGGLMVKNYDFGFGVFDYLTIDGNSIEARSSTTLGTLSRNLVLNKFGGNVGVGNTGATYARLQIAGTVGSSVAMFGTDKFGVTISADNPEIGFNYFYNGGTKTIRAGHAAYIGMFPQNGNIYIGNFNGARSTANFGDISGGSIRMLILQNGNVGIGTTNPTNKLSVNGNIRSKEVVVESGWADYVFDQNYELLSLNDTEKFILENKHLPGIPPAKEIQENGLALGDLQAKMMAKIEELTLHIIELKKEVETLKRRN